MDLGECNQGIIVESPGDKHCEKNWIPVRDENQDQWFIYKWHPMEIGRIVKDEIQNQYKLDIQKRYNTSTVIFNKIRGSTCFIEDTIEGCDGLVGLVHFSEELYP
jgi:hypothetical protein